MSRTTDYILEVARCGGIAKAARNLFITPSALSKFIIQKEDELGVRIFNREGNKFTLTYPGESYVKMLKEMQEFQQKMDLEMQRLADMYSGRFRVGFQMSLAELMTKKVVPTLQDQYPNIRLFMEEASSNELRRMLKTNQLDVVLTLADENDPDLHYTRILTSPVVIAAAKGSPLGKSATVQDKFSYPWLPDEALLQEKFVMDKGERNIRHYASYLLGKDHRIYRSDVMVTNARTALMCVEQDLGIIVIPEILIRLLHYEDKVELYSFGHEELSAGLCVVSDPRSVLNNEIAGFERIVSDSL